jgi:crotonobetainyl-CoA:carnitine CoA-transferase CaiB-like acyl-CoA transferase
VPGCAHRTTREWLASEHALASGLVLEVDDPDYGAMRQASHVAWLAGDSDSLVRQRPAPRLDAEREEILRMLSEAGHAPTPRAEDPRRQGWLDGMRILDVTNVIAGPTIAATLAHFGAEVISVDPPEPLLDPWNTIDFGLQANRGKRSLLADLKTPEGREILNRLLKRVDVVTANALDRQLAPLGIDPENLKAVNPKIVLCQLDAFSGPRADPRSGYPGFDDLVQASTGIMARFGGSLETPEEHAHFGTIDVLAGFCGALAIGLALVQQAMGGGAAVARASLAAAGQLIQIPFMYDYEGRPPFDEPSGREVKGAHALYRCYEAQDGWFFLAATPQRRADLAAVPELADIASLPDDELETTLAARFRTKSLAYWVEALRARDLAAHPTDTMARVRDANLVRESAGPVDLACPTMAFVQHDNHPSGRQIDLVAPNAIRPRTARIDIPAPARKYGAHTREILEELGYSGANIDALLAQGIVAESWSDQYLPD